MDYKYFPHTEDDLQAMMEKVGVERLGDLYAQIPEAIRFRGDYQLPSEMSELEVRDLFEKLGSQNKQLTCFAGYGVYDHYMPSVIPSLLQRSEFLTSYTPYQAEISQGTLHYIFEYQSMMAELTGMDISNASMYDGTTACAEAMMMAVAAGKKVNKVLVSAGLNPKTREVLDTYALHQGIELVTISLKDGVTDLDDVKARLAEGGVAGVIVQQPNVFGVVEDFSGFAESENGNIYISEVIHKAHVEVDEKGTKAAASTAIIMKDNAMEAEPEYYTVTLDRPFVFAIYDYDNEMPLFIGAVRALENSPE